MPHWKIKAAIQRAISLLPASQRWNALFQQYVTRSLELTPARFEARLSYCGQHLDNFSALQPGRESGFTVVEVGTGWFPVVSVGLFLCGAGDQWTFDIDPLLRTERLKAMLDLFVEYERTGALKKFLPRVLPDRVARLREAAAATGSEAPEAVLEKLKIHVRVRDAQKTELPGGSVDLFVSTGVLEYIPRFVLKGILEEFRRVGRAGAVNSHYINLIDQYWYFDSSITQFNFLRYPAAKWKYYNSPLTWQNRMRISDYRTVLTECGYEVAKETNTLGKPEDLRKVPLAPEFRNYEEKDLLVVTSWIAAKLKVES